MYDTVYFDLSEDDVSGVDFLAQAIRYLDDVSEHYYSDAPVVSGKLNGLRVTASEHRLKVRDGSLCKFLLGDNFQTLSRHDAQRAIEKLSDMLQLPMDKANITRLDVAQNFIVKHPPVVYYNHLGLLRYAQRLQEPTGLYYALTNGRLCFYDKNKEQRNHREEIPELYRDRNVLRYERRFTQRLSGQFNVKAVTGATLYDEDFYINVVNHWKEGYQSIKKINDVTLNFQAMKTKKELYKMGILALAERMGGQLEMITMINEAQQRGVLTNKRAYDLRAAVKDACQIKDGLIAPNDAIEELSKKVAESAMYYR